MKLPFQLFTLMHLFLLVIPCLAEERFTHLTVKDGLSQSSAKCLYQDSRGFIWIGTADGLNKYDGYNFTTYRVGPNNINSIGGNDISCIYENPNDSTLWIGTQDAGINLYDRNQNNFISFGFDPKSKKSIPSNHVKDMLATDDKRLWIATQDAGICYFNPVDSSFVRPGFSFEKAFRTITCLEKDKKGNLWIGTPRGLYFWNKADHTNPHLVDFTRKNLKPTISALEFDIKGNLWVGTSGNGVFVYHPSSGQMNPVTNNIRSHLKSSLDILKILEAQNGITWIGTNKGLYKFDPSAKIIEELRNNVLDKESLNNDVVLSLLEDHSGIIWVGTFTGGLNKMDPIQYRFSKYNQFSLYNNGQGETNDIRSVYKDNSGTIWVGTSRGLVEFKKDKTTLNLISESVKIHLHDCFLGPITSTNDFLIISSGKYGILKMQKNGKQTSLSKQIKLQTGKSIGAFTSSVKDYYENIWFGTGYGLLHYNHTADLFEVFKPKDPDNGMIKIYINTITIDQTGKLWLGTIDGKIYSFDIYSKKFELVISGKEYHELISFNKIFSVCALNKDELWIGSDRGLYKLAINNGDIERFLDADGLANNIVYGVLYDKNHKLWCCTNNGISCFNPETKKFQNFTYQDGLQSNEFNEGAFFKDPEGLIYMGGIEGLNIFDPSNIKTNNFSPPVVISDMEIQYEKVSPRSHPGILNKQISETRKLVLSHKQNTFSFEFTALGFSLPERNQYQYSLTEKDKEDKWIYTGNRRIATYTNVPPGEYTFKVKGSNSDGIWNETPTAINIIIRPPYWQTLWFKALSVSFFLGIIYLIILIRLKSIRQQKKILKKLVKEKTKALKEQKKQIEFQNKELKSHNEKISSKNKQLSKQHLQILKQRDNLLQMAEQVEEANQAKFRFFTSVSHELRTPLTLIINPLKDLLGNKKIAQSKEINRRLTNIHHNASKLLLTVNQLLDFRKIETDNMEMLVSEFDLVPFIQNSVILFNELAAEKQIQLSFSCSTASTAKIWADKDKLEKTIYNLLSNAFKFTPTDGMIKVNLSSTRKEGEEFFKLAIKDNGIGIEADKKELIFERFYQLDNPSAIQSSGSGLGLALVKKYVELHKGSIAVNSAPARGSEFIILLPSGESHFDENVRFVEKPTKNNDLLINSIGKHIPVMGAGKQTAQTGDRPAILIIEDDDNLRAYMNEVFSTPYNIRLAENGKKGFQIAGSTKIDLVICDVMLPDINGFKLCEKLKSDFRTSHLPVVLLTSLADKEANMSGIKAGADDFITKPFDLQHLLFSVENLIEGRLRLQKKYSLADLDTVYKMAVNPKDRLFLKNAVKCIEKNLTNTSFNVEMFCSLLKLSQPQCYRKIRGITGFNISEFIRNTRLKKASKLLKSGQYKVNEVAYETGFNDPNYFSKSFVKLYGTTPSDFTKSS